MMKKFLSATLVLVMCFTAMFGLSACDGQNKEKKSNETTSSVIENIEPWKADAASEEMRKYTKFFRLTDTFDVILEYAAENPKYDSANPLTDEFHKYNEEVFDSRMDTLIKLFEAEKKSHPFAQKYIEELNKTNYSKLSDRDKFIFESYAKLLLSDRVFFNGHILNRDFFNVNSLEVNMIDELMFAVAVGTGEDTRISLWFPSYKANVANCYEFLFAVGGKNIALDGMGYVAIPSLKSEETELDVETVKKIINDNIGFFEFLVEYRDSVYAEIREIEENDKAYAIAPSIYNSWIKNSTKTFSNKFGTPDTRCVVSGCSNYIANSGDTNCCKEHSNRCGNCNCYIDGDAMFCMSCLENALK